jgi:ABC-type Fe3+/spermidine/putrescine transport system ATPase subunit
MNIEKNFESSSEENPSRVENLFGHGVKISHIDEDDEIPVGGHRIKDTMDTMLKCDFEELEDFDEFFEDALEQLTEDERLKKIGAWLEQDEVDVDAELFAKLVAFRKVYEEQLQGRRDAETGKERKSLYQESERKQAKLSEVLDGGTQRCAEIAALAQYALQEGGIDSAYIGGDMLRDREHEFASEHSFILVEHEGEEYIYDPSNPVQTNQGAFPSLYRTEASFDDEVHKQKKRFVKAKNIISERELYFGVSDGTNIIPERDLVG